MQKCFHDFTTPVGLLPTGLYHPCDRHPRQTTMKFWQYLAFSEPEQLVEIA